MNQQTIAEVLNSLHDFPENKLNSLLDYIELLKDNRQKKPAKKATAKKRFMDFIERESIGVDRIVIPSRDERNAAMKDTKSKSFYQLTKNLAGSIDGPPDLGHNKKYLQGFGK